MKYSLRTMMNEPAGFRGERSCRRLSAGCDTSATVAPMGKRVIGAKRLTRGARAICASPWSELSRRGAHMRVDGSIAAVVTGGASGLGEASARALAARGAKVALFDLNQDRAEQVAAEIGGIACAVDVSDE